MLDNSWSELFIILCVYPSGILNIITHLYSYQELCGPWVFLIFTAFLIVFIVFTFLKVPETRGKTFEEIANSFGSRPAATSSSVEDPPPSASAAATHPSSPVKEKVPLVEAAPPAAAPAAESTPLEDKSNSTAQENV